MNRTWPTVLAFLLLGGVLLFVGCKKKTDPPPLETDPERLQQIEKELDEAAQKESAARKLDKRTKKDELDE